MRLWRDKNIHKAELIIFDCIFCVRFGSLNMTKIIEKLIRKQNDLYSISKELLFCISESEISVPG